MDNSWPWFSARKGMLLPTNAAPYQKPTALANLPRVLPVGVGLLPTPSWIDPGRDSIHGNHAFSITVFFLGYDAEPLPTATDLGPPLPADRETEMQLPSTFA